MNSPFRVTQGGAISAPISRWTPKDEATLAELVERKNRIYKANIAGLDALLASASGVFGSQTDQEFFTKIMVTNADAFRDALEPFDSGGRPG